ncbi:MAG: hypothetical protein JNL42_02220 [Anaerolineae bacterium]|nr:hypothetical protein [Anaerolineae bacterium]
MDALTLFFGVITLVGVGYFLLSMLSGGDFDLLDSINLDFIDGESGFGCMVVAAFLAAFGGIGLLGSLSGWNAAVTLLAGGLTGALVGRLTMRLFRFMKSQQSEPIRPRDWVGLTGRVTINTPAGKTGEAIFEEETIAKRSVRALDGGALQQGEQVVVVEIQGGIFYVRRKDA